MSPTNDVSYYLDMRYFIKSDIQDGYQSVLGTYAPARDLVPVKDPATGAPVLWDNVTETYFHNAGKYLLAGGGTERPFRSGMVLQVK